MQSYDSYRSWLVACDNTLFCEAKGFSDGEHGAADLIIRHEAGPSGMLSAVIKAQSRFTLRHVLLDGKPLTLAANDWTVKGAAEETTVTSRNPAAVLGLVARLRNGSQLELGQMRVPLDGFTAALLRMDERQGRVGGVTALVRKGPIAANRVPPAPPIPVVRKHPIAAKLASGEPARLIARARAGGRRIMTDEGCEADTAPLQPEAYALDGRRALVFIPCLRGAYQGSSVAFIVPRGSDREPIRRVSAPMSYRGSRRQDDVADIFTEGDFDPATGTLAMFAKGRGLADCGFSAAWIWDGHAFKLANMARQDACGGAQPGDWPRLFRSRE